MFPDLKRDREAASPELSRDREEDVPKCSGREISRIFLGNFRFPGDAIRECRPLLWAQLLSRITHGHLTNVVDSNNQDSQFISFILDAIYFFS